MIDFSKIQFFDLTKFWEDDKKWADAVDAIKDVDEDGEFDGQEFKRFYGRLGERTLSLRFGLKMNDKVYNKFVGDGGEDFKLTDVKAITYWSDPWLKITPRELVDSKRNHILYYPAIGLDEYRKRAWIIGYATRAEAQSAKMKTFKAEYGPMHSIYHENLHPIEEIEDKLRDASGEAARLSNV